MLRCISPFCSRPCCYREINDRYNKRNCDRTLHNAQLPNVITIRKIPYLINELQLISVVYLDATANTLKSESRARSWFLWKFRQEQFVSPCTAWLRRSCRCMLDVCVLDLSACVLAYGQSKSMVSIQSNGNLYQCHK